MTEDMMHKLMRRYKSRLPNPDIFRWQTEAAGGNRQWAYKLWSWVQAAVEASK